MRAVIVVGGSGFAKWKARRCAKLAWPFCKYVPDGDGILVECGRVEIAGVAALAGRNPAPVVRIGTIRSVPGWRQLRLICVSNSLTNMGPAVLALPGLPL